MNTTSGVLNRNIFFIGLMVFGVIIRTISLFTKGTSDVDEMISWIEKIDATSWSSGYSGVYFPSSYVLFYVVFQVSSLTINNTFLIFAISRFIFDLGFFATLIIALKNKFIDRLLVVLLWLNPLFIALSLAGYTDIFSISIWFFFIFMVYKYEKFTKYNVAILIIVGFSLAFFAFLKPQTIYLVLLLLLFLAIYYLINRKNLKLIISVFLGFFVVFLLYGKLLNPTTILSCGEKFGPITISSFTNPPEVFWNKCLEKEQVLDKYPATGPQICIDASHEAYAPIRDSGYCVQNFEFSESFSKEVFIIPGLAKLMKQAIGTSEVMPSYSANMPNVWAIYVKNSDFYDSSKQVWQHYASKNFNNLVIFINMFIVFSSTLYLFLINIRENLSKLLILIGLPITILVPNFATMAHENHFALGSLISALSIGLLSKSFEVRDKSIRGLYALWLLINLLLAVNVVQLYVSDIWLTQTDNKLLNLFGYIIKEYLNPYLSIYHISYAYTIFLIIFIVLLIKAFFQKNKKDMIGV